MTGETCTVCLSLITGRAVHDRGEPWCEPCRKSRMISTAQARADRLVRRDPALAALIADIQRAGRNQLVTA
jgi:hypothetical protein